MTASSDDVRARRDRLRREIESIIESNRGDLNSIGYQTAMADFELACEAVGRAEAIAGEAPDLSRRPVGSALARSERTTSTYKQRRLYSYIAGSISACSGIVGIALAFWRVSNIEASTDWVMYLTSALPSLLLVATAIAVMYYFGALAERMAVPLWIARANPFLLVPPKFTLPILKASAEKGDLKIGGSVAGGGPGGDDED